MTDPISWTAIGTALMGSTTAAGTGAAAAGTAATVAGGAAAGGAAAAAGGSALGSALTAAGLLGGGFGIAKLMDEPKAPALPATVPMPDPEDRIRRLEAQRRTTARMASSGRESTMLSSPAAISGSPATRTTSKLG